MNDFRPLPRSLVAFAIKHTVGLATFRGQILIYRPGQCPWKAAGVVADGVYIVQSATAAKSRIRMLAAA